LVDVLTEVLKNGERNGVVRPGIDPLHLYISMSALSYFYFSNSATLSVAFERQLSSPAELKLRRAHCVDVIMSYVTAGLP
jgi:hypothetical protein